MGPAGGVPSACPVKTATSKPGWLLAADLVVRPDAANRGGFTEAGGWGPAWQNLPAHKNAGSALPAGGNDVFIDGSVRWVKAKGAMMFSRSWRWAGSFVSFRRTWERWNPTGPACRKCRNPGWRQRHEHLELSFRRRPESSA